MANSSVIYIYLSYKFRFFEVFQDTIWDFKRGSVMEPE